MKDANKTERYKQYKKYLKSKDWQIIKRRILERDKYKCTNCGSKLKLNVHHETYDNIFNEKDSDLVTLCIICHKKKHSVKISKTDKERVKKRQTKKKNSRVKLVGNKCPKCLTPVIKIEYKRKKTKPHQKYYFLYGLKCPNCRTIYNTESAKVFINNKSILDKKIYAENILRTELGVTMFAKLKATYLLPYIIDAMEEFVRQKNK